MDDVAARKVSVFMKNAITSNNYHGHVLGKTVKQLEVERDLKMLSLQTQKDKVGRFSSSPKMKAKKASILVSEETVFDQDLIEATEAMKTERKSTLTHQFLPLIRSHSAKTRRMGFGSQQPHLVSNSSTPSPKSIHHYPPSPLSTGSLAKLGQNNSSIRHSTSSPSILTAKFPTGLCDQVEPANVQSTLVHRGLSIRPLSWKSTNKQPKQKQHDDKPNAVFSRLYQVQSKPKKSVAELMDSKTSSPRLERRRRSISMPDLTDEMDDLQNCRYLRQNSTDTEKPT